MMAAQSAASRRELREDAAWALAWTGVAILARAWALKTDFWFDEIWSLDLAKLAPSAAAILFRMPSSANHPLTTLWLYLVGARGSVPAYRLASFAFGALGVPAAMAAARRFGRAEARAAAALSALWFPMLVYSTEARGYAGACACAWAAWACAGEDRLRWPGALACVLGLWSHMIFLLFYGPLFLYEALAARDPWPRRLERHALPLAVLALSVAPHLARMEFLGAPPYRLRGVLADAVGLAWGGFPAAAGVGLLAATAALAVPALRRTRDWILVAPATAGPVAIALLHPQSLFSRYFLIAAGLQLPLLACALVRCASTARAHAAGALLGAAFLWSQAAPAREFWRYGRGGYREALAYASGEDASPVVVVSSDRDDLNGPLVNFHAPPGRVVYAPAGSPAGERAGWLVRSRVSPEDAAPSAEFKTPRGARFALERVYPHAGPSGFDWYLYRRRS